MESTRKYVNPSPEESANFFAKLFFCWLLPFMRYGYKNDLKVKDLHNATKADSSGSLGDQLERNWMEEVKKNGGKEDTKVGKETGNRPSLKRAIMKTFYKSYCIYGVYLFIQCAVLKTLQPLVLAAYINYYNVPIEKSQPEVGWLLATGVVGIAFLDTLILHHCNIGNLRVGMRVRVACCSLVYRKLLRLSQTSLGQTAAGQLVNLLSNDVQRFDFAAGYLHYFWLMPIQSALAFYLMYKSVGLAAVAGMATSIIQAIPLQGYLSNLQGQLRHKIALRTDSRVKVMSEITSGIQVIKMYAWEKPFEKVVAIARKSEIGMIRKISYIRGVSTATMVCTERFILYVTLVTFILLGGRLTGDLVFSLAQLFNTVQLYMAMYFPLSIAMYAEANVSIKRLEKFLTLEENVSKTTSDMQINANDPAEIKLTKVHASWTPDLTADTLLNINLHIKPGTLCCVVGNVGSGKTSLLQVILKELPLTRGRLEVSGSVSYASQEPWLFVSSVRNNILFGRPFVNNRYQQVVSVCALERDFEQFPYKDQTLVGERGVSLSGGQRARINLARAVYAESNIYLFDDPLSAVDTHVGKHLFQKCIKEYLHGKTRILVTHQLQFMTQADLLVILKDGQIENICSPSELSENELSTLSHEPPEEKVQPQETGRKARESLVSIVSHGSSIINEEEPQKTDELVERGSIPASTYWEYCKAGGSVFLILFLVFLMIWAQVMANSCDLWLRHWTNSEELLEGLKKINTTSNYTIVLPNDNTTVQTTEVNNTKAMHVEGFFHFLRFDGTRETDLIYIYVYTIFVIMCIILTFSRSILYFKICTTASKVLHNKMFSHILQAPMRFFDTNPSGRILNRFSKDMGAMDEILPRAGLDALQVFLIMSGILIINFMVTPWMIIPTIFLGAILYYLRGVYLATAQDVKRLEGVTKAPVFSYISASLYGMPTIRSSNAEDMVIKEFDTLQDQHTGSWFLFLASNETFGFFLDLISTTFLAIVTYQFLITRNENTFSGNVGLLISQSLILTGMIQYGVRQTAETASNMISVERILQYTKLEKEGPFQSLPASKIPKDWPSAGRMAFMNVYLKYVPTDPPVLKNLNFEINSGEKVGIVGRTGAGKSSIIASIFRLSPIEGTITIDGIDTSKVGLADLRSNISIIPQEPVLFSASVKYNLDPFEKHSDDILWKALDKVELKGAVEDLNQQVSEGGSNFSAGQRQLLCLARAIVRNNKILIMDEATANVDPQTDAVIQRTMRKAFKNCTVLIIAHRLNTIMDSDKVIVMDQGKAIEFDHPHNLLQNPSGQFTSMLHETGVEMEEALRKVAEESFRKKYSEILSS